MAKKKGMDTMFMLLLHFYENNRIWINGMHALECFTGNKKIQSL